MKFFETLSQDELLHLEDAIPQIAVLIAGADGKIDEEEKAWADKLTEIRTYAGDKVLHEFYEDIHVNFPIKFNDLVKTLPTETAARQQILSDNLSNLNEILAKLDPRVAYHLYASYLSFAKSIAETSGGFLRFATISSDEKAWIHLPMITPVAEPQKDENEESSEA
jgi:hypothetical protein